MVDPWDGWIRGKREKPCILTFPPPEEKPPHAAPWRGLLWYFQKLIHLLDEILSWKSNIHYEVVVLNKFP